MKTSIIVLITLLATATANSESLTKKGLSEVTFNVKAENPQGEPISFEHLADLPIVFYFPVITGGVFGMPMEDNSLEIFVVDENNQIQFDLNNVKNKFEKNAEKLRDGFRELGLKPNPKRTKLARMGSFARHVEDINYVKGTLFKKPGSDEMLLLVYFNRKASLSGDISLGGEIYKHDVSIPRKGFYWLESVEIEPGVFKISRCENFKEVDLVFRIDANIDVDESLFETRIESVNLDGS